MNDRLYSKDYKMRSFGKTCEGEWRNFPWSIKTAASFVRLAPLLQKLFAHTYGLQLLCIYRIKIKALICSLHLCLCQFQLLPPQVTFQLNLAMTVDLWSKSQTDLIEVLVPLVYEYRLQNCFRFCSVDLSQHPVLLQKEVNWQYYSEYSIFTVLFVWCAFSRG